MAIAAVDAVIADVVLVAEGYGLLDRREVRRVGADIEPIDQYQYRDGACAA